MCWCCIERAGVLRTVTRARQWTSERAWRRRATRERAGVQLYSGSARARPRARSAAFRAVWCVYLLSCKSVRTRCGTAENDRYRAKRGKLISFFRVSLRPYLDLSATSAPARPQTQTARPQLRACFRSPNPPARHRGWLKGIVPTRHRQLPIAHHWSSIESTSTRPRRGALRAAYPAGQPQTNKLSSRCRRVDV